MGNAKITGISVQDFKRVKLVEIQPNENGLTIIGGRNAQGKSSVLDAIAYALGGETFRPSDINNHDSDGNAKIRIEINGLVVERAGKNGALKITDARGMRGNQTLLNEIISKFALDLGTFMRASEVDKAKLLLKMFPELEGSLEKLKKEADAVREERADINRDAKRIQAQYEGMTYHEGLPETEVDVNSLSSALSEANAENMSLLKEGSEINMIKSRSLAELDKAKREEEDAIRMDCELRKHDAYTEEYRKKLVEQIEYAKQQLEKFEKENPIMRQEIIARKESSEARKDEFLKNKELLENEAIARAAALHERTKENSGKVERIQQEINSAVETNRKIQQNNAKKELYDSLKKALEESAKKTEELDNIEKSRKALLSNADLPLKELSITEDGKLLFKGQEWDCMSGAERLKVATAICMKSKPGCGFVLIDGLEAMDQQTLAEFGDFLEENSMQGIGTIVGNNSATVVIEDGMVAE